MTAHRAMQELQRRVHRLTRSAADRGRLAAGRLLRRRNEKAEDTGESLWVRRAPARFHPVPGTE